MDNKITRAEAYNRSKSADVEKQRLDAFLWNFEVAIKYAAKYGKFCCEVQVKPEENNLVLTAINNLRSRGFTSHFEADDCVVVSWDDFTDPEAGVFMVPDERVPRG